MPQKKLKSALVLGLLAGLINGTLFGIFFTGLLTIGLIATAGALAFITLLAGGMGGALSAVLTYDLGVVAGIGIVLGLVVLI